MVTAPILRALAISLGVELPITEAVCTVLAGGEVARPGGGADGKARPENGRPHLPDQVQRS